MKKSFFLLLFMALSFISNAQVSYDSITINRFRISEEMYGARWQDTLKLGRLRLIFLMKKQFG